MRERLSGWGRTSPSVADVVTPGNEAAVVDALQSSSHVVPRGLGRSYGDAAQVAGGLVLRNDAFTDFSPISDDGVVTVGSGVSIDEIGRAHV